MNRAANLGKKRVAKGKEKWQKRAAKEEKKWLQKEVKEGCEMKKGQPAGAYGLVND